MGSAGSKAAKSAGAAARKYPSRASGAPPTSRATQYTQPGPSRYPERPPGPTVRLQPQASSSKSGAVDLDGRDPDFAESLRKIGPVQPNPTYSPSSQSAQAAQQPTTGPSGQVFPSYATNPAIAMLSARERLEQVAEAEKMAFGKRGFAGKTLMPVETIKKALTMRDEQGMKPEDIERELGLKRGTVATFGRMGVVEVA